MERNGKENTKIEIKNELENEKKMCGIMEIYTQHLESLNTFFFKKTSNKCNYFKLTFKQIYFCFILSLLLSLCVSLSLLLSICLFVLLFRSLFFLFFSFPTLPEKGDKRILKYLCIVHPSLLHGFSCEKWQKTGQKSNVKGGSINLDQRQHWCFKKKESRQTPT